MYIDTTNGEKVIPPQREHRKMTPIDCCLGVKTFVVQEGIRVRI